MKFGDISHLWSIDFSVFVSKTECSHCIVAKGHLQFTTVSNVGAQKPHIVLSQLMQNVVINFLYK